MMVGPLARFRASVTHEISPLLVMAAEAAIHDRDQQVQCFDRYNYCIVVTPHHHNPG